MSGEKSSRTYNVTRNAFWGVFLQILTILCQFVSRTVFVNLLGRDYLGVNDIFFSILQVMAITDLGIGTAVTFCLYRPLAEQNEERIASVIGFYKKAFFVITSIVAVIGLLLIPFLDVIIKDAPDIRENLVHVYLVYLLFAVSSYLFSYKRTLITADQKDYIVNIYYKLTYFLQIVLQIIVLLITHNYILFLCVQIGCTILYNYLTARKADKMYPYLKTKQKLPLEQQDKDFIRKNMKSLVIYRFSDVILNSIDSLLMSALVGVTSVALCSNYLLIQRSVSEFIKLVVNALTASIGNLNVTATTEHREKVFRQTYIITHWLYGFLAVGIITCVSPLIKVWLGDMYIMADAIVVTLAVRNYIEGIQYIPYTYRTTSGHLSEFKYAPLLTAVLNIALSFVLARYFGVTGIFLATIITRLITTFWINIVVVYRKCFEKSALQFFVLNVGYMLGLAINGLLTRLAVDCIPIDGILGLALKVIVCTLVFHGVFVLQFIFYKDFRDLVAKIYHFAKSMLQKRGNLS